MVPIDKLKSWTQQLGSYYKKSQNFNTLLKKIFR